MPSTNYTPAPAPSKREKGAAGGIASLDNTGKVPSSQLPDMGSVTGATMNGESISPDSQGVLNLGSVIRKTYGDFEPIEFTFDENPHWFDAYHIWTDGNDIYYNDIYDGYMLNKFTHTWENKVFNVAILGEHIWTDGENIYYSNNVNQYIYNKNTGMWDPKTWNGLTSYFGSYTWTDGNNIYYSGGSEQYVLDKLTSTWSEKTWAGIYPDYANGIWTDGENIYYSYESKQYVFDKSTSTWSEKQWFGLTNFKASQIWDDNENIYCSTTNAQYVLNKSTSTWSQKEWNGSITPLGNEIWKDGENIYYSHYDSSASTVVNYEYISSGKKLLVGEEGAFGIKKVSDVIPDISGKLDKDQGSANAGKVMTVNSFGLLEPQEAASGLPDVTASDNGKFLRVVNGEWAAETVLDAGGVSF